MRKISLASAGLILSLIVFSAARAGAQKPDACCAIVALNAATGVATAKVNATGNVFEFKAASGLRSGLGLVTSVTVGQAVYANFANRQVSLDGRTVCCTILSGRQVAIRPPVDEPENLWTTQAPLPGAINGGAGGLINGVIYVAAGAGVAAYDPATNKWTTKAPAGVSAHGSDAPSGVVNGILYVAGGDVFNVGRVANVDAYDPTTNTWTTRAPMTIARADAASAVVNGILYVVGGRAYSHNTPIDDVEAYDPATNVWRTIPRMYPSGGEVPYSRYGARAAVVNGILYVVGGVSKDIYGGYQILTGVQSYDPTKNLWTTKAPMLTARVSPAVGVINGIMYVAGGSDWDNVKLNSLEAYNPVTNTWTTTYASMLSAGRVPRAPMPTARNFASFVVFNGMLFVIGGLGSGGAVTTVEAFHP